MDAFESAKNAAKKDSLQHPPTPASMAKTDGGKK